ncbi:hypothetical protein BDQ17DRAFT_1430045 [Cyathus striatus]|nr:hypothetical protein BDQ17DRAFT_1430045 [Cyathus striatus]
MDGERLNSEAGVGSRSDYRTKNILLVTSYNIVCGSLLPTESRAARLDVAFSTSTLSHTNGGENAISWTLSNGLEDAEGLPTKDATAKVVILFKGVGNAPVLRQNMLGWSAQEPLYTYINSAFSPALDDVVSSLFKAFGTEGHLIANYNTTMAWG